MCDRGRFHSNSRCRTQVPARRFVAADPNVYLICTPEMARAMIRRWISLVPSKMV